MSRQLQPCGTTGACQRHRRRGETPCEACLDTWAEYMAAWRAARAGGAA